MSTESMHKCPSRVAVIGAGPAGSLFAYSVLRLARRKAMRLQVDLYDERDFHRPCATGCNQGAGVISENLYRRLKAIGIDVDQQGGPIRRVLRGYIWHTKIASLRIDAPPSVRGIRVAFRGSGPQRYDKSDVIGLDQFLLERATQAGARHINATVTDVQLATDDTDDGVKLSLTDDRHKRWEARADVVVGAFGLNSRLPDRLEQLGIGYRRPRWRRAAQTELVRQPGAEKQVWDNYIQVFNLGTRGSPEVVLTPKGKFATLTLLGSSDLGAEALTEIKGSDEMAAIFAAGWSWPEEGCRCLPILVTKPARHFFRDRFALIGDAACCRYYKNGLESALRTAQLVAETIVRHGVTQASFKEHYSRKVRSEIMFDNYFGRMLLRSYSWMAVRPVLTRLFLQVRTVSQTGAFGRHDSILWNMLTGNQPYRHVFAQFAGLIWSRPAIAFLLRFFCSGLKSAMVHAARLIGYDHKPPKAPASAPGSAPHNMPPIISLSGPDDTSLQSTADRRSLMALGSGGRVSIVGGGPGGTSCAIKLIQLAKQRNLDLEVTIHEPKDFAAATATYHSATAPYFDTRVNQCIGVLSPPIHDLLTRWLKIDFPDHLVQRYIIGYKLHSKHQTITLDEPEGASYALRRITFDNHMMSRAVDHGARLNLARVVRIERDGPQFKVHTTSQTVAADVVVGAFGSDDQTADVFTRCFGYRAPQYMQTVITKLHPGGEFMHRFGPRIHAFLPRMKDVEFGAITPKFNHLAVNIAGPNVHPGTLRDFMALDEVAELLPQQYDEKGCETYFEGRFPTSVAGNFFSDRMVIVGDASGMLRPFKGKGINAAILGGCAAADVIVHKGLATGDFLRYYYPTFRQIVEDLWYARTARWLCNVLANCGGMDAVLEFARQYPALRRALTESVAGVHPYKQILKGMVRAVVTRR